MFLTKMPEMLREIEAARSEHSQMMDGFSAWRSDVMPSDIRRVNDRIGRARAQIQRELQCFGWPLLQWNMGNDALIREGKRLIGYA